MSFNRTGASSTRHRRFLERKVPDFISPTLWPPNSPDLNLVDYSIRRVLQEKVYRSRIANVGELKMRLIDEWARGNPSNIRFQQFCHASTKSY